MNLVSFLESRATMATEADVALKRLLEASEIYRERLDDPTQATALLEQAHTKSPGDLAVLEALMQAFEAQGDAHRALDCLDAAIDNLPEGDEHASLLCLRADKSMQVGRFEQAVADLKQARQHRGDEVRDKLRQALEASRQQSIDNDDVEAERGLTLELVQLLVDCGDTSTARDMMMAWTDRNPSDQEALHQLIAMARAAEQWDTLAQSCERLIDLDLEEEAQANIAMEYAAACEHLGDFARALSSLESVHARQPQHEEVYAKLIQFYEATGAFGALAEMMMRSIGEDSDDATRMEILRKAGDLFIRAERIDDAIVPLEEVFAASPKDHETTCLLADAYIRVERLADAGEVLLQAIENHKKRRSPQLGQLQHLMARLASFAGDTQKQLQWLQAAIATDKNNGEAASELAWLAMELGDTESAQQALRAITLMKVEAPMSRAMAFYLQAKLAHEAGETRRAILWARKAIAEDAELQEAKDFLASVS